MKPRNRLELHRQPRKASPLRWLKPSISRVNSFLPPLRLQQQSPTKHIRQSYIPLDSPPVFSEEGSRNAHDDISNEPPSEEDDFIEQQMEEIGAINEQIEENIASPGNKKKRKCEIRRLRKTSAKKHICTKCARNRLHKYFSEANCMICKSCLGICSTCGVSILSLTSTKAKKLYCITCTTIKTDRIKSIQRQRMQALRLKKSLKSYFWRFL